jgi:hypothetical protein
VSTQKKGLKYLGIALAVFIGVISARLVFVYGASRVAVAQIEKIGAQAQQSLKTMNERSRQQSDNNKTAAQQARAQSEKGLDLYRRCVEFSEFYKNHPSDYAREQRDEACDNYEIYTSTGKRKR